MDDRLSAGPGETAPQPHNRPTPGRPRKHMGVASSDPDYLPPVGPKRNGGHSDMAAPANSQHVSPSGSAGRTLQAGNNRQRSNDPLHYDRYISVPKKGRSIFTARQARQRHRLYLALAVLVLVAVALALVWFFLLR